MRLDQLLVARGLARTRSQAREAILRGAVSVDGVPARRASQNVADDAEIAAETSPYVGRGAHKLVHALECFGFDVTGAAALDVGASTGGFTDVLLRRGAARLIALDVGHGQLAPEIAADPRVIALEGVNARGLGAGDLPFAPEFVVFDVSFISLGLVVPPVAALAAPAARLVALVKPQFEVGRAAIGKGGIVRDEAAATAAVDNVAGVIEKAGCRVVGRTPSPIAGGDGNREWLVGAVR